MHVKHLKCVNCGKVFPKDEIRFRCSCGGSLDIIYDYEEIRNKINWTVLRERPFSHLRYREFYPVIHDKHLVSLKEGGTPLIKAKNLLKKFNTNLFFKLESLNPTGSFKDRGTSVEISKALDFNAKEIVVASTGNMGSSIAAYCARAQIKANILVPEKTPEIKKKQMKSHGAEIIQVKGDYTLAMEKAVELYRKKDIYLMGDYPYRGEGEKSVGYELLDQIKPDYVFLPVGNGTLMKGTWKGIMEFERIGLIDKRPKMLGVQAENCNTVIKAFQSKSEIVPVENPRTVATAIACGNPLDGKEALNALKESNGFGVTVSDKEILKAKRLLAQKEGIYAEESGAVSLAGFLKLMKEKGQIGDELKQNKNVVCVVTGHGLKT